MASKQFRALLASAPIWMATLAWVVYQFTRGSASLEPSFLVAVAVVTLGEILEVDLRGGRSTPVSSAVVFALFVVLPPVEVALALLAAFAIGLWFKGRKIGFVAPFRSTSRRLASTLLALWMYQVLIGYIPALPVGDPPGGELLKNTMVMMCAGMFQLFLDSAAAAWLIARRQRIPARPLWRGQVWSRLPIHVSFLSVAALMALTYTVLGAAALALFMLPLLAARAAFRRYAAIHKTYVQTVRALSKVPEMAGYAPVGHSTRVAALATAIARDQGLSDAEVEEIEFAALMHDIGLISFDDPSELLERPKRDVLSEVSATLIGQTPYLTRVATIVRASNGAGETARLVPADEDRVLNSSQIVKIASEFVEAGERISQEETMDGMAARYDARLVASLGRVLIKP